MSILNLIRRRLAEWLWPTQTTVKHITIARLTPDMWREVQKRANGNTFVTHQTTDLQAGHMLGVQHALSILAQDFTISS